jgi:hypothetical protein
VRETVFKEVVADRRAPENRGKGFQREFADQDTCRLVPAGVAYRASNSSVILTVIYVMFGRTRVRTTVPVKFENERVALLEAGRRGLKITSDYEEFIRMTSEA